MSTLECALTNQSQLRENASRQILQYLLEHPSAADSAQGVQLWWLRNEREFPEVLVREVLELLLEQEWLVACGRDAGTRVYALNAAKIDAIRRFTGQAGGPSNG